MGYLISFIVGFGVGSIPFGFIVARFCGIDIREHGSGNIGATNVSRVCGKKVGLPVFILDAGKGFLATFLASHWFGLNPALLGGVAAILGHAFTPWLKLRGGKGISTGLGVFVGLTPIGALVALLVWGVLLLIWRWVSVASMGAVAALTLFIFIKERVSVIFFVVLGVFILILYLHRSNIRRLIRHEEPRIGKK